MSHNLQNMFCEYVYNVCKFCGYVYSVCKYFRILFKSSCASPKISLEDKT